MIVKELIDRLNDLDENLEVTIYDKRIHDSVKVYEVVLMSDKNKTWVEIMDDTAIRII